MVVGNLAALAQVSVRRLLAYSAIAHAGYMLLGIAYPAYYGVGMLRLSFAVHGPRYAAQRRALLRPHLRTDDHRRIRRGRRGRAGHGQRPDGLLPRSAQAQSAAGAVLLVLFLSLAGIPPLVGFWAKFNLFAAVLGVSAGAVPFALVALAVALQRCLALLLPAGAQAGLCDARRSTRRRSRRIR